MTTQDFTVAHDGRTTSGVKYFPACGRFPVVVFAHGYNGEARDFAPFAEFLAKKRHRGGHFYLLGRQHAR